jgi:hypothetical protein
MSSTRCWRRQSKADLGYGSRATNCSIRGESAVDKERFKSFSLTVIRGAHWVVEVPPDTIRLFVDGKARLAHPAFDVLAGFRVEPIGKNLAIGHEHRCFDVPEIGEEI